MTAAELPAVSAPTALRRSTAGPGPTRVVQLANFAVSQLAWFAAVLGAAHVWGLFAITLNVNLRWLRGRPWLAACLGAVAGPAAFSAGVRLGGAHFVHPGPALATLACLWALALPLLGWLAVRFDGVTWPEVDRGR